MSRNIFNFEFLDNILFQFQKQRFKNLFEFENSLKGNIGSFMRDHKTVLVNDSGTQTGIRICYNPLTFYKLQQTIFIGYIWLRHDPYFQHKSWKELVNWGGSKTEEQVVKTFVHEEVYQILCLWVEFCPNEGTGLELPCGFYTRRGEHNNSDFYRWELL